MKLPYLLLFLLILSFACERPGPTRSEMAPGDIASESDIAPSTKRQESRAPTSDKLPERKLIKDGSMSIKTDDIRQAKQKMDGLVRKFGAEYGRENYRELHSAYQYQLRVDVPTEQFDKLVDAVESSFTNVLDKSIEVRDVTEEFTDLETRLESKQAYLKRYREILDNAKSVEDILKIEAEIRKIEEEIESVKGRLKYLGNRTSTGQLDITLTEEIVVTRADAGDGFVFNVRRSFLSGWNFIVGFFYVMIRLWPLWVFLVIGLLIYGRFKRARSTNMTS